MTPSQFKEFAISLVATNVFSSNFFFWQQSGYFAGAAELKPLLHTWSLAVEEQFYLFFPLLLIFLNKLSRKIIIWMIIAISIASLLMADIASRYYPSADFYLLPTRAWELGFGAILALSFGGRHIIEGKLAEIISGTGLAMILVSILIFDESFRHPSLWTVIPVLGTTLILLAASQETIVGKLLSLRPMVAIGLVSYSAYLWHQPLYAFARLSQPYPPSLPTMLVLAVLSLLLAALSWRFVEQPFRTKKAGRAIGRKAIFVLACAGSGAFIGLGLLGRYTHSQEHAFVASLAPDQLQAYTLIQRTEQENSGTKKLGGGPCIFSAVELDANVRKKIVACAERFGPGLLILGDSHAIDLYRSVVNNRPRPGFIVGLVSGGCRPYEELAVCEYYRQLLDYLEQSPGSFDLVIFEQAGFYLLKGKGYAEGDRQMFSLPVAKQLPDYRPDEARISAIANYLSKLSRRGRVVWLGPRLEPHIPQAALLRRGCNYPFKPRLGTERIFHRLDAAIERRLDNSSVRYLSQNDLLAFDFPGDFTTCKELYWSDGDHFSNAGERRFGARMRLVERLGLAGK